jgi:hypothetical protein
MKRIVILLLFFLMTTAVNAQKIDGQWRGYFDSNGDIVTAAAGNTEYVLEIEIKGTDVTGYSYSYFQDRKYFVICSIKGTFNKSDKTMLVTETARLKGVTPPGQGDCLQTHFLKYQKTAGVEQLVGRWKPAAGQGDCGTGATTLIRKTLDKNIKGTTKGHTRMTVSRGQETDTKKPANKKTTETIIRREVPTIDTAATNKDIAGTDSIKRITQPVLSADINYEKRTNTLVKTIEIASDSFQVFLYDSGDVDGDSVSLFYNGKLLLSHQRLELKPITLTLDATTSNGINELVMYAETLGTIPPNTALMIVTDGTQRYEIYLTSDLEKSATIKFVHQKKDN